MKIKSYKKITSLFFKFKKYKFLGNNYMSKYFLKYILSFILMLQLGVFVVRCDAVLGHF